MPGFLDNNFDALTGVKPSPTQPTAIQNPTPPAPSQLPPAASNQAASHAVAGSPGAQPAPAQPQQAPSQPVAPAQPSGGIIDDKFNSLFSKGPSTSPGMAEPRNLSQPGSTPMMPIQESPLGLIDRARMGWARTPAQQKAMLDAHFGADNVQFVGSGDSGGFVAHTDGAWRSIDPHFQWSNLTNAKGLMEVGKDIAQMGGEYGVRAAGAGIVGAQGAMTGAAMGAVAGPIGAAVGGFAGGVIGGAIGGAGGELAEQGARLASGDGTAVQSKEELAAQLHASMLFGASQEALGPLVKMGGKYSVKALSGALDAMSDTPTGKYLASKLVGALSGLPENVARIRVEDPAATAVYDQVALADKVNNTSNLGDMMKSKVQGAMDNFYKMKKQIFGQQYDAVDAVAKDIAFSPSEANLASHQALVDGGYVRGGKIPDITSSANVERAISSGDKQTLQYVLSSGQKMQAKINAGSSVTSQEMRNVTDAIANKTHGPEGFDDPNLSRILQDYSTGLKNHFSDMLYKTDPEAAANFSQLNAKYGPLKEMMQTMSGKSADNKVDMFVKQIVKDDGTFNSSLMSNIADTLKTSDPTKQILQMHVANKSTAWWGGGKIAGIPVGIPNAMAKAVTGFSATKDAFSQFTGAAVDAIPYMDHARQFLSAAGGDARKMLLSNPEAVSTIMNTIRGAATDEAGATQSLLNQAGVAPQQPGQSQQPAQPMPQQGGK
jgi:hypothetical protein